MDTLANLLNAGAAAVLAGVAWKAGDSWIKEKRRNIYGDTYNCLVNAAFSLKQLQFGSSPKKLNSALKSLTIFRDYYTKNAFYCSSKLYKMFHSYFVNLKEILDHYSGFVPIEDSKLRTLEINYIEHIIHNDQNDFVSQIKKKLKIKDN